MEAPIDEEIVVVNCECGAVIISPISIEKKLLECPKCDQELEIGVISQNINYYCTN